MSMIRNHSRAEENRTKDFHSRKVQVTPLDEVIDPAWGANHNVNSPLKLTLLGRDGGPPVNGHALDEITDFFHLVENLQAKLTGW